MLTPTEQLVVRNLIADKEFLTACLAAGKCRHDYAVEAKLDLEGRINEVFERAASRGGKKKREIKPFIAPTLDEVKAYAMERKQPASLAIKFHDYYTTSDWRDAGGKPLQNWKAKFVSWEHRNNERTNNQRGTGNRNAGTFNEQFDIFA